MHYVLDEIFLLFEIFFAAIPGHRVEVVHEVCHVLGEVLRLAAVGPAQQGGQCWVSGDI